MKSKTILLQKRKREIEEKELMSKRISKYIASFDYFDKYLIVLSATMVAFLLHHLQ